ncbi:LPS translocon maturation chaperone LptM [Oceanisphaera sp.]|uniref:LPS translocon maturation chaperone LptM n=1 Tax=Oceanisphaera sp. TaxID=1929979 RepID=UPI003A95AFE9
MLVNGISQGMEFTVVHRLLPIAFESVSEIIRVWKHIHSQPMNIFKLTALVALCLSLLGCGLKGPLTLPEPEQKQPQTEQS